MPDSRAATIEAANRVLLVEGDGSAAERLFTPSYVAHATERDLTGGPEAVRGYVATLGRAFSDLEVEVEILAEDGDRVAWQRTLRGTQSGGYAGFPASGPRVVWRDMLVTRFEGGLIAEEWVVTDLVERLLRARNG